MTVQTHVERIPGYCALCISRCGAIAVVEHGRFVALEPDPSHPTLLVTVRGLGYKLDL